MSNGVKTTWRKARVEHRCQSNACYKRGCGRLIAKGERYLSVYPGGLSSFPLCEQCAAA